MDVHIVLLIPSLLMLIPQETSTLVLVYDLCFLSVGIATSQCELLNTWSFMKECYVWQFTMQDITRISVFLVYPYGRCSIDSGHITMTSGTSIRDVRNSHCVQVSRRSFVGICVYVLHHITVSSLSHVWFDHVCDCSSDASSRTTFEYDFLRMARCDIRILSHVFCAMASLDGNHFGKCKLLLVSIDGIDVHCDVDRNEFLRSGVMIHARVSEVNFPPLWEKIVFLLLFAESNKTLEYIYIIIIKASRNYLLRLLNSSYRFAKRSTVSAPDAIGFA